MLQPDITNSDGTLSTAYRGQILTGEQIQKLVQEEVARQLSLNDKGLTTNAQASGSGQVAGEATQSAEATDSATLADTTNQTLDQLNQLLATTNLKLDTLTVTGQTQLAQTQIAGTLSQDGTLVIDLGRQINVLGNTLYLQNDTLAGDAITRILLDVGSGALVVDRDGNVIVKGIVTAEKVEAKQFVVTTGSTKQAAGSATIAAGQVSITIPTGAVEPGAKILVTASTPTGGKSLYVSGRQDLVGFTVTLDGGAATGNINFDWLIIGSRELSQN
jgi:hypothetical protein